MEKNKIKTRQKLCSIRWVDASLTKNWVSKWEWTSVTVKKVHEKSFEAVDGRRIRLSEVGKKWFTERSAAIDKAYDDNIESYLDIMEKYEYHKKAMNALASLGSKWKKRRGKN